MGNEIFTMLLAGGMVALGEMGDKSQLLAMAFATRYKAYKVLIGILIATVLNHGLAVVIGSWIGKNELIQLWIQGVAALAFIFFGLWAIKGEKDEEKEGKVSKCGAIVTVALAFFLGEFGDKTQLTMITMAVRFPHSPFFVLIGGIIGMLVADTLGIIIGTVLSKKVPQRTMRLISAIAFILFGLISLAQVLYGDFNLGLIYTAIIIVVVAGITAWGAFALYKRNR